MKIIKGTPNRPRLAIFRSHRHFYAQVIDDQSSKTLFSCSTLDPFIKKQLASGQNCEAAKIVGKELGLVLMKNNLDQVVFDRRFRPFHGRIAAFADGVREAGLKF
uniref:Large ribosomal subunit protein uL18c n=1 Tax=Eustigmatophyceae sp. Ndem 8/9T-3m6.8 TaxID=2506146 RepID=A0A410D249_9STRA|nr:ribosomal protein L18 [Eustigmatophyceae sp. Ndem 8/9T-3m6.8]QAA11805.1 ribosomal protein L18 [Eustigmatophyceae sp. Ndem 8/9T-3m6.8]